jgi:hypothetical protein
MVAFSFSGCYKLKENFIMKGEWLVKKVEMDGGSTNFMDVILPDYNENTCEYKIYFGENGVCNGQYYVDGVLNYAIQGSWVLLDPTHLWVEMDQYVKGSFEIEEQSTSLIHMYAERNIVKFYDIGETQMFIIAERR